MHAQCPCMYVLEYVRVTICRTAQQPTTTNHRPFPSFSTHDVLVCLTTTLRTTTRALARAMSSCTRAHQKLLVWSDRERNLVGRFEHTRRTSSLQFKEIIIKTTIYEVSQPVLYHNCFRTRRSSLLVVMHAHRVLCTSCVVHVGSQPCTVVELLMIR